MEEINKPPPLNRDYGRDPTIKGLKTRGFSFFWGVFIIMYLKTFFYLKCQGDLVNRFMIRITRLLYGL